MKKLDRIYFANDLRLAAYLEYHGEQWDQYLTDERLWDLFTGDVDMVQIHKAKSADRLMHLLMLAEGVRKGYLL